MKAAIKLTLPAGLITALEMLNEGPCSIGAIADRTLAQHHHPDNVDAELRAEHEFEARDTLVHLGFKPILDTEEKLVAYCMCECDGGADCRVRPEGKAGYAIYDSILWRHPILEETANGDARLALLSGMKADAPLVFRLKGSANAEVSHQAGKEEGT